ncbi:quinone-dependent dihydroorotate dehydrogenase [Aestuariirhabdus sp. Z084]|uniref:quinone-dependent dihydroorotate dehydrogenase n=1 Tax=Aestuariirhabdus haliotis TaxID=2918751 RepID=UPI00201B3BB4|nr:quinone-dependent dihydroorotate dehydrogenase [Aestuariirhabdus haliotis]MCL6414622.1 quinone-dependent dihydroorotate dehydrogenase [Aestuariirhabdus haliotis]MCL6418396.1 quinone-dependent dihydroorotate dehydrogenase [Aestuariirhabdus haliotis]
MYSIARRLLFSFDPEVAHELGLDVMGAANRLGLSGLLGGKVSPRPCKVMGIDFQNPVGLAAGLDKNGDCIDGLGALGFGFLELGTVTPRPQPGNPKPRMFRLPEKQGIINRMGFNNKGVDHLVANVQRARYQGVIGINIGKNFDTPVEEASNDYLTCFDKVYPHADYIAANISSPNTPGLRSLQHGDVFRELLERLKEAQHRQHQATGRYVPIAIKIAPDMEEEELRALANVLLEQEMDGVIATNTTLDRTLVEGLEHADEAGGLSGDPVRERSTETIRLLASELSGKLPIIGVGGISDAVSAAEKIAAGASLVQIYSGFIYRGPDLIAEASEAVAAELG